jgi:hypothetical protein
MKVKLLLLLCGTGFARSAGGLLAQLWGREQRAGACGVEVCGLLQLSASPCSCVTAMPAPAQTAHTPACLAAVCGVWLLPCLRCRWLRSLMLRNGLYHTRIRSLQPSRLGALLLHLPAVWPRLEYLLQVGLGGLGGSGKQGVGAGHTQPPQMQQCCVHAACLDQQMLVREACCCLMNWTYSHTCIYSTNPVPACLSP